MFAVIDAGLCGVYADALHCLIKEVHFFFGASAFKVQLAAEVCFLITKCMWFC